MNLVCFLKEHKIVSVGCSTDVDCLAVEFIADDPQALISCVAENGCYISEIMWWHRALISKGSEIGYGGPKDPRDPENYYFAETDICSTFSKDTSTEEYESYLSAVKLKYSSYDIYPAFDIYRR